MTLEEECVAILAKQMGPAAKIFLIRQCQRHLQKSASQLQLQDLPELAKLCFLGTQSTLGVPAAESIRKGILEIK